MTKLPTVKKQLRNLHPEAERVYATLEGSRPDKYGFLRYGNTQLYQTNLRVTPDQLRRMTLFLDALFRLAEHLGDNSGVEHSRESGLSLKLLGERVRFEFWQGLKKTPHVLSKEEVEEEKRYAKRRAKGDPFSLTPFIPQVDYLPTEQFTLQLQSLYLDSSCVRRTWKDTPDKPLELQLDRIALGLTKYAAKAREVRLERAAQERERAAELERQRERRRQQAAEQERRTQLERDAEAWHRAELVRHYVAAVETEALSGQGAVDLESELGRWLAWARQHADRIDPRGSVHSSSPPLEQFPGGVTSTLS